MLFIFLIAALVIYVILFLMTTLVEKCMKNMIVTTDPSDYVWNRREKRSLQPYRKLRSNEIISLFPEYIPPHTITIDGPNCIEKLVACSVVDPFKDTVVDKCLSCIQQNAKCIHYDVPVFVRDRTNKVVMTYPANKNVNEGYCTPIVDATGGSSSINSALINDDDNIPKVSTLRECHPNTGLRNLTKLDTTEDSYIFTCSCIDSTFFTQEIPLMSNCSIPVSCENTGGKTPSDKVLTKDGSPFVKNDIQCVDCPVGTRPDKDLFTGNPICVKKRYGELTHEEATALLPSFTVDPSMIYKVSEAEWLDDRIKKAFLLPDEREIINPCSIDPFTNIPFSLTNTVACTLEHEPIEDVWYCNPGSGGVASLRRSHDVLKNNNGKYSNGCFVFGPEKYNGARDSNVLQIYEYWNSIIPEPTLSDEKKEENKNVLQYFQFSLPTRGYRLEFNALLNHINSVPLRVLIRSLILRGKHLWLRISDFSEVWKGPEATGQYDNFDMQRLDVVNVVDGYVYVKFVNSPYPVKISTDRLFLFVYDSGLFPYYHQYPIMKMESGTGEKGVAGIPAALNWRYLQIANVALTLLPHIGRNHRIPLVSCYDIGSLIHSTFEFADPIDPIHDILSVTDFTSGKNGACFVSCYSKVDRRLNIFPNYQRGGPSSDLSVVDYKYASSVIAFDRISKTISNLWLENPKDIVLYLAELPKTPDRKLFS